MPLLNLRTQQVKKEKKNKMTKGPELWKLLLPAACSGGYSKLLRISPGQFLFSSSMVFLQNYLIALKHYLS